MRKNVKTLITKLLKLFGFYKTRQISISNSTTAIVISGVENSPKWGSCSGALTDCDTFQKIISKAADNYSVTVLRDEQATVKNWKEAVEKAVEKPLAIVFYSGHGGSDTNHVLGTGANEVDGIDEFLCLYDKPLIDDEVWKIISKSKGRVFLVFDCCHSGTMFRTAKVNNLTNNNFGVFTNLNFKKLQTTTRDIDGQSPSILCWSACADDTVARGNRFGGLFTNAIKNHFGVGQTYKSIWNKLASDKSLQRIEVVQINEVGTSFKDELFCR